MSAYPSSRFASRGSPRAQLSPLLRRVTLDVSTRQRLGRSAPADSLAPRTPSLGDRVWNPHLLDRLQTPLSRVRE